MIILDTNVLSELMRPAPARAVVEWIAGQPRSTLHVTSLSCAEILFGIARMPPGRRRDRLDAEATAMFDEDFADRVLGFEVEAARAYATLASERERAGNQLGAIDGLIAAIALTHRAAIATRDRGFAGCGVTVIDPWDTS